MWRVLGALSTAAVLSFGTLPLCAQAPPSSLASFYATQGFDGTKLQRRFCNHLYLPTWINGKPGNLVIDNSAPTTVIHRESAGTYGLSPTPTNERVSNVWGATPDTYSAAKLRALQIGHQTLTDIPVLVAREAVWLTPPEFLIVPKLIPRAKTRKISSYYHMEAVNGLLGADVLKRTGAVVDCGHQMLYTNAAGPNGATSERLAAFLSYRGFTRIPMRLTRDHQFEVDAAINGHPTRLLVSTGASFTFLGREAGAAARVFAAPLRLAYDLGYGHLVSISGGSAKDLAVGDFIVHYTDVTLADVSAQILRSNVAEEANSGLLGIEVLSMNYAVIDFGSMNLYMRRPDRRR
ncbi:MAG TPA: aspartyl protease family protein [Chthoniobacterales bacterium]|jgi:predicted aspartyl protease